MWFDFSESIGYLEFIKNYPDLVMICITKAFILISQKDTGELITKKNSIKKVEPKPIISTNLNETFKVITLANKK